ncbi:MAG: deoxyguanosinetriphosphate triphosphohydrolase [Pelagibacteraceae bacterium]|nr:deoxyguanosinetriphosphate triphosphohydrolase [Pelagibacteraceae bacterium]
MKSLSNLAVPLKSKGRLFKEKKTQLRTDFQRDRDRIIHSTAFRRLKHKTQVFVNTSGDHFRTRITHSLEVAQIARTLSKFFNLNEDLCETLSLAHDLGHTPFGHAGEEALNDCMKKFGGFDHNVQTIRIIIFLENRYYEFKGLNLTLETLDGLLKHNGPIKNVTKYNKILGKNYFRNKINFSLSPSLEAQIASISDDIAYNSHDLEDGLKSNLFTLDDLKTIPILKKIIFKHKKMINNFSIDLVIRQVVREIINEMVKDIIISTKRNIKYYKLKDLNDVYKCKYSIVTFSKKMSEFDRKIKIFLRNKMYYHKNVKKKTNQGKFIINKLFLSIKKNPKRYINVSKYDKSNIARSICDFIAGMTDRYAINLYKKNK